MRTAIWLNETHLGENATPDIARRVVAILREKGYEEVRYGHGGPWRFPPEEDEAAEERDEDTIRAAFECAVRYAIDRVMAENVL